MLKNELLCDYNTMIKMAHLIPKIDGILVRLPQFHHYNFNKINSKRIIKK